MSDQPSTAHESTADADPIETVTSVIPFIIPAYGVMLIFILAMIAVTVG